MTPRHAVGFLAALAVLIALAVSVHFTPAEWAGIIMLFGTATVTYGAPLTTAGTTPPTTTQMAEGNFDSVRAQITFADADTTAVVTHNLGLSTTELSLLLPDVSFYPEVITTPATTAPVVLSALRAANNITFTKAAGTDTGGVVNVVIKRPHTIGR